MTVTGGAGGGPPDAWQLSAELKPKAPDEPAAEPGSPVDLAPPAWRDAAENVRATVKWLVTAFAVVGGVMFAKGFVTTPELSWEDDTGQLTAAWVVGSLGLFAIGWLILQAVSVLRPTLFELGNLPQGYRDLVDAEPRFYLPSDAADFEDYLARFDALRRQADDWGREVVDLTAALAAAQAAVPKDPAAVTAATQQLDAATATYSSVLRALTVYKGVRKDLLDRAGYWSSSRGLDASGWLMVLAAVMAAVGGIGYQLLLAAPEPADPEADDEPVAVAVVGELVRSDTDAGLQLWRQLRLTRCQADRDSARVPVVVATGKGTDADPYVVSTLPSRRCPAMTFTVLNGVAQVNVPPTTVITYTPAPTPSGSPLSNPLTDRSGIPSPSGGGGG